MRFSKTYLIGEGASVARALGVCVRIEGRDERNLCIVVRKRNVLTFIDRILENVWSNLPERGTVRPREDFRRVGDVPEINTSLEVVLAPRCARHPTFISSVNLIIRDRTQSRNVDKSER